MPSGSRASVNVRPSVVPDRDGVHAFEPEPGIVTPVDEAREQRFGVALRPEREPGRGELGAQVEVVVDLAVEDDRVAAILRGDRLMAAGDVDDGEATHAEAEIAVDELAAVVRSAMDDAVALRDDRLARDGPSTPAVPPGDAAHASAPAPRLAIDIDRGQPSCARSARSSASRRSIRST